MENASKALLIAGAILIVIILIGIILIVKNNVADYYASEEQLKATEDKAKFNEQFSRFNRNDVQGYELISLVNKVVDYNERVSEVGNNDVKAKKITVKIKLCESLPNPKITSRDTTSTKVFQLTYDNELRLFKSSSVIQSDNNNTLKDILNEIKAIEEREKNIAVLTKKISSIFVTTSKQNGVYIKSEQERQNMMTAISTINSALGVKKYTIPQNATWDNVYNEFKKFAKPTSDEEKLRKQSIYEYYEFTQFKKAKFKCTKLHYDEQTGKVDELDFEFTGKIE